MNRPLACILLLLAVCGTNALKGYAFQQGMDSGGADIQRYPTASLEDLKNLCESDSTCAGFNTLGYLKSSIVPLPQYVPIASGSEPSEGLYVKVPVVSGYVFTQGMDVFGGDIGVQIPGSPVSLKAVCDADITCLGFTTWGFLKNIISSTDQWHYTTNDPLEGVYIKVNYDVSGYSFASGLDSPDHNMKLIKNATIADLEAACNANTSCVGFNTDGHLKIKIQPIENWVALPSTGPQGLFVKLPALNHYNFVRGMDIYGGDIKYMANTTVKDMRDACDNDTNCFAFTTFGYLKNHVPIETEWHRVVTLDPLVGVYLKTHQLIHDQTKEGNQTKKAKKIKEKKVKLPSGTCWLDSYPRGAGVPISSCPGGAEKNGALCYPACNDGFYGVGPVCWSHCPGGYRDDGMFCAKPGSYGRGAGYALWSQDKCNRENGQGCEKWGAMYYPRCAPNFFNVGCCVCSPNCPNGMTDIGVSCAKHSYGRGVGSVLTCAPGQDESAGLCYNYCREGYKGIGPVCWNSCPPNTDACGALCVPSGQCAGKILSISAKAIKGGIKVAGAVADASAGDPSSIVAGINGVNTMLEGFNYPICGQKGGVLDTAVQVTGILKKASKLLKGGEDDEGDDGSDLDDDAGDLGDDLGDVADVADMLLF